MKQRKPRRPRRTLKQKLHRTIRTLREKVRVLRAELEMTVRERDTARRQMRETVGTNHHNAAAHRASEVAALMSNVAQNAELDRLRAALPAGHPDRRRLPPDSLAHASLPAVHVPAPIPVAKPEIKSP